MGTDGRWLDLKMQTLLLQLTMVRKRDDKQVDMCINIIFVVLSG